MPARAEPGDEGEGRETEGGVDVPPWIQREQAKAAADATSSDGSGFELPWPLALIFSVIVGIAAVRLQGNPTVPRADRPLPGPPCCHSARLAC